VLVVIPAHNEAVRVGSVVAAVKALGLPVLVVDDGSEDGSQERAAAAGASVVRLTTNRGKGAALKAGFAAAVEQGYEGVLTLDADGQHDPGRIPLFLEAWSRSNADLVVGQRDFERMPPVRKLTNTLARGLFSWAVGRRIPDNQSGFRLHSRRLLGAATEAKEEGFAFEVEVLAICLGRGYRVEWVPIPTLYGNEESDIRPWQHLVSFLRVTRLARRMVKSERRSC
jgi:glycosyltransferase involved in cell wall biosynthesis